MPKILILGGYGLTGRRLAHHLLERTQVELVLAGRSQAKAEAFCAQLNPGANTGRVCATRVDAGDRPSLEAALAGVDLLLVAAPTTHAAGLVIQTALDCGVDYLIFLPARWAGWSGGGCRICPSRLTWCC